MVIDQGKTWEKVDCSKLLESPMVYIVGHTKEVILNWKYGEDRNTSKAYETLADHPISMEGINITKTYAPAPTESKENGTKYEPNSATGVSNSSKATKLSV